MMSTAIMHQSALYDFGELLMKVCVVLLLLQMLKTYNNLRKDLFIPSTYQETCRILKSLNSANSLVLNEYIKKKYEYNVLIVFFINNPISFFEVKN